MEARTRLVCLLCLVGVVAPLTGGCEHVDKPTKQVAGEFLDDVATESLNSVLESLGSESKPEPSRVYAKDFSRQYPEPKKARTGQGAAPTATALDGKPLEVEVVPPEKVNGGIDDAKATPEAPDKIFIAVSPPVAGDPVLVDAIVGSINGKPVRASEFLAPLAGTLASPLKQPTITRDEWRLHAMKKIYERLNTEVEGELLVSAGMAELSPPERDNLALFVLNEKRKVVAAARGSEEAADRKLRDEGRGGLAQFLTERKRELVIQRIIELKIRPRVQVSMRDIEVYYRQHPDKYDSPSQYIFRMIVVPKEGTKNVEAIGERLAAGDSFADVASSPLNTFNVESGGRFSRIHESSKPQSESSFFGVKALNEAARSLEPRKWAGPVETDDSFNWLYLEEVIDRSKTLYEAQLEIENTIRTERSQDEFRRYLTRLRDNGSYTALDQMTMRLTTIAEHQFLGPVKPGVGIDANVAMRAVPTASVHTFDAQEAAEADDAADARNGAEPTPTVVPETSPMPDEGGV